MKTTVPLQHSLQHSLHFGWKFHLKPHNLIRCFHIQLIVFVIVLCYEYLKLCEKMFQRLVSVQIPLLRR